MFNILPPELWAYSVTVTLVAGFIKGVTGFALPLVMVSGMGILVAPDIVLGAIVLPVVVSNLWQAMRQGLRTARAAVREHWRYCLVVCVMILLSSQTIRYIPLNALFVVLGVPVVSLCAVQLLGWRPRIRPEHRRRFEWGSGVVAGTLGGLAGSWGPPTVLYLLALDTPRARHMAVQGVIYGLGSLMLLAGHSRSGILNAEVVPLSLALIPAAVLGQWFGLRTGDRFDQALFRKVTLWVLVIAGANLIRRGLFG